MFLNNYVSISLVFSLCLNRFSVVNIIRLHGCQIFPKMPEKILLIKIKPTLFELLQVGRLDKRQYCFRWEKGWYHQYLKMLIHTTITIYQGLSWMVLREVFLGRILGNPDDLMALDHEQNTLRVVQKVSVRKRDHFLVSKLC